jgi:hypothetical protein
MGTTTTMQEFPLPEMQRIALEEVILQVLLLQLGRPEDFLSRCLQPPSVAQLRAAIATLIEVKAIAPDPALPLTALGYHLAHLPVDVRLGKMLVYASLLQVIEPALTIAAYLSCRSSPFMSPLAQRDVARRVHCESYLGKNRGLEAFVPAAAAAAAGSNSGSVSGGGRGYVADASGGGGGGGGRSDSTVGDSDHLAVVRVYDQWRHVIKTQGDSAAYAYCRRQFLSMQKMQEIHQLRALYRRHLIRAGLIRVAPSVASPPQQQQRGKGAAVKAAAKAPAIATATATAAGVSTRNDDGGEEDDDAALIDEDVEDCLDVRGGADDDADDEDEDDAVMDKDEEELLLRCALCAGFAPHFVRAVEVIVDAKRSSKTGPLVVSKRLKLVQADQKEVRLHPSSLLCGYVALPPPSVCVSAACGCLTSTGRYV